MDFSSHDHQYAPNRHGVIPTPVRLNANLEYSGKGVTIAFLDSGFFPHPDLVAPVSRVGLWSTEILVPHAGRFEYKFIVNGHRWIEDPSNGMKVPDNYGGLNSVLVIE